MHLNDPAVRHTLARLAWQKRAMKKLGIHPVLYGGNFSSAANTDVRRTWRKHGWRPAPRPTKRGQP